MAAVQINVADTTQRVMPLVRTRMESGSSYLMAVCAERDITAQLVADCVLKGRAPYTEWLEEYFVLCQLRDRILAVWSAERARGAEL